MAADDRGLILANDNLLSRAKISHRHISQIHVQILGIELRTRHACDISELILAVVTEARRLGSHNIERAAQLVDDESGHDFVVIIIRNQQQRTVCLHDFLENRQNILNRVDLLIRNHDQRIVKFNFVLLMIGNHVRRNKALVILQTFRHFKLCLEGLGLIDIDDTITANLLHCLSDDGADLFTAGRNRRNVLDISRSRNLLGVLQQLIRNSLGSLLHAFPHQNRVRTLINSLQAIGNHCLRQQCSRCRAIASLLVGVVGNFIDKLSAHVLILVLELDFLRNCDTIIGDER